MNSTFINTLLISLVLFRLLRNWRQVFTNCCNSRKENRSFSSPCREQKYTTSLAARLQHTWIPGCFFTGLSNYHPGCVLGTFLKMCPQAAAVGDGSIAPSLPAPPACSLHMCLICKNKQGSPAHPFPLCCDCHHHFRANKNTRSPETLAR